MSSIFFKKSVYSRLLWNLEQEKNEGLFDNLDDEMDPEELDHILKEVNEDENDSEEAEESDTIMEDGSDFNEDSEEENENEENEDEENGEEEEENHMEEEAQKEDAETNIPQTEKSTSERFRDSFMTKITQAFGTDLDQIRQEPTLNGPRLNVLIDSLEAGIDIFSSLEQEIILADEEKTQNL
ncbi:unnamed protein product [Rhizopus stolonifer]